MSEMFKDCFAYRQKQLTPELMLEECDALEVKLCKEKGYCRFYKKKANEPKKIETVKVLRIWEE